MRSMFALVVAAFSLVAGASAEDCPFDHAPDCGPGKTNIGRPGCWQAGCKDATIG